MPTIVGAGSIGLALGACLAQAGLPVRFVTRRAAAAERLRTRGLDAEDPSTGERFSVGVDAGCELREGPGRPGEPVLLCVRLPDVEAVAAKLESEGERPTLVSFQNDVAAEPLLAARGFPVIGGVWRQTCTRVDDGHVRFLGRGRAVVGVHPEGGSAELDRVTGWLLEAGYDVGVSPRIGPDKWLKLCVNLMSAPNALVRRDDHRKAAFVEIKVRLLEEARRILQQAGIEARSCDGRDRSLDEEIVFQRESLARGDSARRLPIYNQVWTSLRHGAPGEASAYHRRFVEMGARHGIETPANTRLLAAVERATREQRGPESVGAEELLG